MLILFLLIAKTSSETFEGILKDDCTCVPTNQCNNNARTSASDFSTLVDTKEDLCEPGEICCHSSNVRKRTNCGQRNLYGVVLRHLSSRILADRDFIAEFGEFPWMVAIRRKNKKRFSCGGALIHPNVVVTAAHCTSTKAKYEVRVGEWDLVSDFELYPHQDRNVKSVVLHPRYSSNNLSNDISLLFLNTPVIVGENVGTICLPFLNEKFDHTRCIASGFGNSNMSQYGTLKKVELPLVHRDKCEEALRRYPHLGSKFTLDNSSICAGGEKGMDTCKGDAGSALACPFAETGQYVHVGIVSWGVGCGIQGTPGVYTDVAGFRDWIDEEMEARGLKLDE